MDKDFSFKALMDFLQYVEDHGLWKSNTAIGYRAAASKVEGDLTEQEASDVRQIDLDLLFQRFMNRNRVKVSPRTLATYRQRLQRAISEFERYLEDPIDYRSAVGGGRSSAGGGGSKAKRTTRKKSSEERVGPATGEVATRAGGAGAQVLNIPFPLRSDFLASVQIPRDLKKVEAERLAAFIKTLALDPDST